MFKKEPLISICMPNHNYERFIGEAINSVLSQTYPNFELIIVDDVSTDKSQEIIESYKDPRIRFYKNENNLHTSGTVNRAINLANGELIAVLHSDDKYEPNFLSKIVEFYNKYPDQKVFIAGVYFDHLNNTELTSWHPFNSEGIISQKEILIRLYHQNNIGNGVNAVVHSGCFKEVGLFSTEYKYLADYDFWLRLAERFEFVYIPEILTYYRIHESNTTHFIINNLTSFKEGLDVFNVNVANSKIISKEIHKKSAYISDKRVIHKAFQLGIKYKSGKIMRDMLDYSRKTYPRKILDPFWYFAYRYSSLITENLPEDRVSKFSFLGRLILYPHKLYMNYLLERLIAKYGK